MSTKMKQPSGPKPPRHLGKLDLSQKWIDKLKQDDPQNVIEWRDLVICKGDGVRHFIPRKASKTFAYRGYEFWAFGKDVYEKSTGALVYSVTNKGTQRKAIELAKERVDDNFAHMDKLLVDFKANIDWDSLTYGQSEKVAKAA